MEEEGNWAEVVEVVEWAEGDNLVEEVEVVELEEGDSLMELVGVVELEEGDNLVEVTVCKEDWRRQLLAVRQAVAARQPSSLTGLLVANGRILTN